MTNCTGTPAERFLERYIQGTLPPLEQQEFEEHYFDCPVCLAQLETLQAVKQQLARRPVKTPKATLLWPVGLGALGAIGALAAMLVIGFFCYRTFVHRPGQRAATVAKAVSPQIPPASPSAPPTPNTTAISQLADLSLPPFQAANLRGINEDSVFDAGMKAYAKTDCRSAIDTLSRVKVEDSNALAAHFYSGVCQMHRNDFAVASLNLRKVSDAGDSPQQEAALYYLAQIALAKNDAATARHYLEIAISLHGDFQRRAQAEIAKLPVPDSHP